MAGLLGRDDPQRRFTRESLAAELNRISNKGWIKSRNPGNDGGVGNNLEDELGIVENNVPLADAGIYEIKAHRANSISLITLFHSEPSPKVRGASAVDRILLPLYGWPHKSIEREMSFRSTTSATEHTDRGFVVEVDRGTRQVQFHFHSDHTDPRHAAWLASVRRRVGNANDFATVPHWSFADLEEICSGKIHNTFYVEADARRQGRDELLHYTSAVLLSDFSFSRFLKAIEDGKVVVDFDARTHHNHGTKFRMRMGEWPAFYGQQERILPA